MPMVTRSALPQNLTTINPSAAYVFDTLDGWTRSPGTGVISLDTTIKRSSTGTIKLTPADSWPGTNVNRSSLGLFVSTSDTIDVWFYTDCVYPNAITLVITVQDVGPVNSSDVIFYANSPGWHHVPIAVTWNGVVNRMVFRAESSNGSSIYLDSIEVARQSFPGIIFSFDDGFESQYDIYSMMKPYGVRGTLYVCSAAIGATGNLTLSELQEMYADGWAIANHTNVHNDYRTSDAATVKYHTDVCTAWLETNGMPRAARHFAYPFGYKTAHIVDGIKQAGMLTARTTPGTATSTKIFIPPVGDFWSMRCEALTKYETVDQFIADWKKAKRVGGILHMYGHNYSDFPVIDDMVKYISENRIRVFTIDEWYEGLTNPRYRSLPVGRA